MSVKICSQVKLYYFQSFDFESSSCTFQTKPIETAVFFVLWLLTIFIKSYLRLVSKVSRHDVFQFSQRCFIACGLIQGLVSWAKFMSKKCAKYKRIYHYILKCLLSACSNWCICKSVGAENSGEWLGPFTWCSGTRRSRRNWRNSK